MFIGHFLLRFTVPNTSLKETIPFPRPCAYIHMHTDGTVSRRIIGNWYREKQVHRELVSYNFSGTPNIYERLFLLETIFRGALTREILYGFYARRFSPIAGEKYENTFANAHHSATIILILD